VLRFVGEDERRSGVPTIGDGGVRRSAARYPARYSFRARLIAGRFRRARSGDIVGSELVSERWSPAEELQLELDRSRRFGHHFALVCISSRREIEDRWASIRELAYGVSSLLRRVDRVWIDGAGVYVLLPECDRTMVEALLDRLGEPLSRLLGEDNRSELSSAVFPEDGLTSGALLSALNGNRQAPSAATRHRGTPAA
jgi:hypothetical protein